MTLGPVSIQISFLMVSILDENLLQDFVFLFSTVLSVDQKLSLHNSLGGFFDTTWTTHVCTKNIRTTASNHKKYFPDSSNPLFVCMHDQGLHPVWICREYEDRNEQSTDQS